MAAPGPARQAGEQHPPGSDRVDAFHLPRQLDASTPVLISGLEVVPLVGDPGQAKVRLGGNRLRRITCQDEDSPVGLGRQRQLVVCFLYLPQTESSRCRVDGSPKRRTDSYDFGIGPAGRDTVS